MPNTHKHTISSYGHFQFYKMNPNWRTPNSLKDSNVNPNEKQRKEELGRAP
jgi:hypothetical protein